MLQKLTEWVIRFRLLVIGMVLALAGLGVVSFQHLPIDAVPDITNVQVQINTTVDGFSPLEVEQRLTLPIETAMQGLPKLQNTRSLSRYGLSQVTVVFKDGTDIYFARQQISERLAQLASTLPQDATPTLGPISTGLGEIYMWTVDADKNARKADGSVYSLTDLREIQDWIIKPQLRAVQGVAEVNSLGGYAKQFHVMPNVDALHAYQISLDDFQKIISKNNQNTGAGYIEQHGEQYLVRAEGQIKTLQQLEGLPIPLPQGGVIPLKQLAEVAIGGELRTGAATTNGRETVLGTVFMMRGANSREVSRAVDEQMQKIQQSLPQGISVHTVYNRTHLIDKSIATVEKNLVEGALLVILILFVFLGNIRAAMITAAVIPLVMLLTLTGMLGAKVSANLMSLGALDFGIIVDGTIVIVENAMRRLAHAQQQAGRSLSYQERKAEVLLVAQASRRPLIFGQLIIMVVYMPIFALSGIEGKMFHPMAITVVIAMFAALILSITFVPAALALFLSGKVTEKPNKIMVFFEGVYHPILAWAVQNKAVVLSAVAGMLLLTGALSTRMGTEFIPNLNEGDIALHAMRIPSTNLTQSVAMQKQLEKEIATFPEVATVFSKIGTAEIATDPMPPNVADTFVMLKPRSEWANPDQSASELLSRLSTHINKLAGNNYEFSQPIQMRFNELISGVRSDVAVKVFGDDMASMLKTAETIASELRRTTGAADVKIEQTTGLPTLALSLKQDKLMQLGLSVEEVHTALAIAIGGHEAGLIYEGDRRFEVVVRLPEAVRETPMVWMNKPLVFATANAKIAMPLSEIATLTRTQGFSQISRENGKRRVVVTANVRGRDVGSFVKEAQIKMAKLALPAGYWIGWGGTFEQIQSATARLQIVIPIALVLVFGLLFVMFGNVRDGLVVFTGIPFALTGGIVALWLRGLPFSMSAGVGFIALSGVAVLNGLVMLSAIQERTVQGIQHAQAVVDGAMSRLRPVLMTALVASLGFVPMALSVSTGAEVQRPLATVVIGGVLSSTLLTLLVLPLLYDLVCRRDRNS